METVKVAVVLALVSLVASQSVMVELEPVNPVGIGPIPMSVLYAEGQDMTFKCTATPLNENVNWLLGIPNSATTAAGAVALANSSPRVVANVAGNNDNPSSITILNAMLGDSGTNVTCKDGNSNQVTDTVTIFVEGIPPCPNVTLVGTTDSSIYLSWVPTGLLPTTQYMISTDPDINGTINTTDASFRFTDLEPLTEYSINVSACNEVGCNDSCSIVYTTGPMLDEDMVSVCSMGGSNPSVTVFVQYNSSINNSVTGFVVSISGSSLTKSVNVTGDGIYSAYFDGVTLSSTYNITVQPFNGPSRGNMISREITIRSVISLTAGLNYSFTCVNTCVGPLSVLSCGTTVTCGTASPSVVYTNVESTNYTTVPECVVCTATTVAQIIEGQQSISQTNTLSRIGDNCDGTAAPPTGLPVYAQALIGIAVILVVIFIIVVVIVLVVFFCLKKGSQKKPAFKDEEMKNVEGGNTNNNNNNNNNIVQEESESPVEPSSNVQSTGSSEQPNKDRLVYADLQFAEESMSKPPPPKDDFVVYSEISKSDDDLTVVVGESSMKIEDKN